MHIFQVESVIQNQASRSFPDALQTAVETAEVDNLELLNIPSSTNSPMSVVTPRTAAPPSSSTSLMHTSNSQPQIYESISSLPPHFHPTPHLSQNRVITCANPGVSSAQIFEHSDPRLLHGDTYLQPISTPISIPHSAPPTHAISSVTGSNPSLYSSINRIDDNGMDSPTYIQLDSSSGNVLPPSGPPSGSYSPAPNTIYSATISGGNSSFGHKPQIEYSDVAIDPSVYAVKSFPSVQR